MIPSFTCRIALRRLFKEEITRKLTVTTVCFSDDSSKKNDAAEKLRSLLQNIIKDDASNEDRTPKIPVEKNSFRTGKKVKAKVKLQKTRTLGQEIVDSAREVAKKLPGKPEETEAQLLHKLLYKDRPLSESIIKAASGNEVLKGILTGMKVEDAPKAREQKQWKDVEYSRGDQVRSALGHKDPTRRHHRPVSLPKERFHLFDAEPLGIFKPDAEYASEVSMPTWDEIDKREIRLLVTHPPRNIYEQMVIWTERGMLWKFPIDNEQGLEEEKSVDFTAHIMLDLHLEAWCPHKGPIRHFMELVCVGLSRNHWLSADEKRDHILWYRDFFTRNKELVQELGAGEIATDSTPALAPPV